jgi:hypothetical protein
LIACVLSLLLPAGDLPLGARLAVRFDPPTAKAGEKIALEISITPPAGSLLLALAQPKSLGAPTAVDLEPGSLQVAGAIEEPVVDERPERSLQSRKVRYYPQSLGGTVAVRVPMKAPAKFENGRAEIRGTVTLMFVDQKSGKLTLAPSVPISAVIEETKPPPLPAPPPIVVDARPPPIEPSLPEKRDASSTAMQIDVPSPMALVKEATGEASAFSAPALRWFLGGVAAGLLALFAGPIGVHDQRKWWARWFGWRRFQSWGVVVVAVVLAGVALAFPLRSAIPTLAGVGAFGALLFVTGGGPGVFRASLLGAALRAQPLHILALLMAAVANAAVWDLAAGFVVVFLLRSFAPAIGVQAEDEEDEEFDDEAPRRRSANRQFRRVA